MTDVIGPGTLKLVWASSPNRSLSRLVSAELASREAASDICPLDKSSLLVHTNADPSEVRDWLAALLTEGESLLVIEFERWSSYGRGVDRRWLLRRGH